MKSFLRNFIIIFFLFSLNEAEWNNFMSPFLKDKSALTFLRNYDGVDTAAVVLGANSTTVWNIVRIRINLF